MSDLTAARWQMAVSLGFHILFAVVGIALPLLMVVAEGLWLRGQRAGAKAAKDAEVYLTLAKRWARGAAILFAVGAVSGTVLSFELGLLWPRFMEVAGPVAGFGFALEGFAFFTEAIFLGIYIYGWSIVPKYAHWFAGMVIAASGALSGVLVVAVNAWMNTPAGFRMGADGRPADIDPIAALLNPAMLSETIHMTLAAYIATGFAVAGVHAFYLLRDRANPFHRRALSIALWVALVSTALQALSGDYSARRVAATQPVKLAAMEGQFRTVRGAPLRIGGIPDPAAGETRFAIEIPYMLSWLAYRNLHAEVMGLDAVPSADRPPVVVVHLAFQTMVGCFAVLAAVSLWTAAAALRRRSLPDGTWLLRSLVAVSPLGMIAVLAGWTVTEVGRQPWIIGRVMRTSEALTSVRGLWLSLAAYTTLYLILGGLVVYMMRMQFAEGARGDAPSDEAAGAA